MSKTNILEEIRADQGKPTQCQFCAWLHTQPASDVEQWQAACVDRTITSTSIHRAIVRRAPEGQPAPVGSSSVDGHRKNGHKP